APVATLIPLVVLAALFEAVFALHVGVERVGRYLQVFHEPAAEGSGWEHTAMAFGRVPGAATTDALFTAVFLIAAACNIIPALIIGPTQPELIFVGGGHALFALRLLAARAAAGRQRAIDLRRFAVRGRRPGITVRLKPDTTVSRTRRRAKAFSRVSRAIRQDVARRLQPSV